MNRCGLDRFSRLILLPSLSSFGSTRIPTVPPLTCHRWLVKASRAAQWQTKSRCHRLSLGSLPPGSVALSVAAVTLCTRTSYALTSGLFSMLLRTPSAVMPFGAQTSMPTGAAFVSDSLRICSRRLLASFACAYVTLPGNSFTARVTSPSPLSMYTATSLALRAISATDTQQRKLSSRIWFASPTALVLLGSPLPLGSSSKQPVPLLSALSTVASRTVHSVPAASARSMMLISTASVASTSMYA